MVGGPTKKITNFDVRLNSVVKGCDETNKDIQHIIMY